MTPKQEWHLLVVSSAPIKSVAEARYKAELLQELADEADPPKPAPAPAPE